MFLLRYRVGIASQLCNSGSKCLARGRVSVGALQDQALHVKQAAQGSRCYRISRSFLGITSRPLNKPKHHSSSFPVLDGKLLPIYRHVYEANFKNSELSQQRYSELYETVLQGGGEHAIARHTQRNKKLLVRERLRMVLDNSEPFLELSPLAGLRLPYGDIPSAGCITGVGKICGVWCLLIANDATVKGGTAYPISVKKFLRAQDIAMQNCLPTVYMVDSAGAFLPLQAEMFADQFHGGRTFYNEAIMSAKKIPQVAVVCGSCTAGGAYTPTMAEETVIVDKIGTIFLAGPPLVKAATGEEVSPENLGGAKLHASHLVGIVANNGELTHDASLKGSHFVQLCNQRNIPILFLQNTSSYPSIVSHLSQAEEQTNRLKAQASMMAAVACASVPKITLVVGGCFGGESYAMCGRSFEPNFLFLWPNARTAIMDSRVVDVKTQKREDDSFTDNTQLKRLKKMLEEESTAIYSSARLWDDGVILPQDTRRIISQCLRIIKQKNRPSALQGISVIRM
ncbi:methylcrotonoyl-CoA carboxylase beta chain, mitochondrial-like isoform X3 [Pleurodeles waltl]|uniref:methylcrotonoyl-CoA carboxylase beta chain, mitochondrial-like isoform X3 n=1 Tax=Pleurodeles waltl TaxID=8319 RepID=UPI003709985A